MKEKQKQNKIEDSAPQRRTDVRLEETLDIVDKYIPRASEQTDKEHKETTPEATG